MAGQPGNCRNAALRDVAQKVAAEIRDEGGKASISRICEKASIKNTLWRGKNPTTLRANYYDQKKRYDRLSERLKKAAASLSQ
jgi:hypothetical protein